MTDRQQEYIRLLEERNRLKKVMTEKTADEQVKVEKERGFSTNFSGANRDKPTAMISGGVKSHEKPIVKVHRLPSSDVVRRLLGHSGGENTAEATNSPARRQQQKPANYNANNHNSSSNVYHYTNHLDEEPQPSAFHHHLYRPNPQQQQQLVSAAAKKADNSNDNNSHIIGVDALLLQGLSRMDEDQKKALLELVLAVHEEEEEEDPHNHDNDGVNNNRDEHVVDITEEGKGGHHHSITVAEEVTTTTATTSGNSNNSSRLFETQLRQMVFKLRIRIYSTWLDDHNERQKSSHYCHLSAIRCRSIIFDNNCNNNDDDNDKDYLFLDLLPLLSVCHLSAGLDRLPLSSPAVKSLPSLLGTSTTISHSRGLAAGIWRGGPVHFLSPLDLCFEGSLSSEAIDKLLANNRHRGFATLDSFLSSIEISLWNGINMDNDSSSKILSSGSPAKDVDIFWMDKCLWTGQLPPSTMNSVDVTRACYQSFSHPLPYESPPSLKLRPYYHSNTSNSSSRHDDTNKDPPQKVSSSTAATSMMISSSPSSYTVSQRVAAPASPAAIIKPNKPTSHHMSSSSQDKDDDGYDDDQDDDQDWLHSLAVAARARPVRPIAAADISFGNNSINSHGGDDTASIPSASARRRFHDINKNNHHINGSSSPSSSTVKSHHSPSRNSSNSISSSSRRRRTTEAAEAETEAEAVVQIDKIAQADDHHDHSHSNQSSSSRQAAGSNTRLVMKRNRSSTGSVAAVVGSLGSIPEDNNDHHDHNNQHRQGQKHGGMSHSNSKTVLSDDDQRLRRSLEAVKHAELFNLNRLEHSLNKNNNNHHHHHRHHHHSLPQSMDKDEEEEESVSYPPDFDHLSMTDSQPTITANKDKQAEENEAIAAVATVIIPHHQQEQVKVPSSSYSYSDSVYVSPSGSNSHHHHHHHHHSNRREKRTGAINDFSAKLNTAIDGITGILSTLTSNNNKQQQQQQPLLVSSTAMVSTPPLVATITRNDEEAILPSGQVLKLYILSTHGDVNYVGLNGIELYDYHNHNQQLLLENIDSITAIPRDLSILRPPNGTEEDDPRRAVNLLDGVNETKDDLHQWLAPTAIAAEDYLSLEDKQRLMIVGAESAVAVAMIEIVLTKIISLSMIRIFNFNKSRTHNQRGAKQIRLELDGRLLFEGELPKATGMIASSKQGPGTGGGFVISFLDTKGDDDGHAVDLLSTPLGKDRQEEEEDDDLLEQSIAARPRTAETITITNEDSATVIVDHHHQHQHQQQSFLDEVLQETNQALTAIGNSHHHHHHHHHHPSHPCRYQTAAIVCQQQQQVLSSSSPQHKRHDTGSGAGPSACAFVSSIPCHRLCFELKSSWHDQNSNGQSEGEFIGLAGIEILDSHLQPLPLDRKGFATIRSLDNNDDSSIMMKDQRDLCNLINGINDTANPGFQWLTPFHRGMQSAVGFEVELAQQMIEIGGIRVWNYNSQGEGVLRGVKLCHLSIYNNEKKEKVVTLPLLLRLAPGYDGMSFGQTILFDELLLLYHSRNAMIKKGPAAYITPRIRQQPCEAVSPITGLAFTFILHDNHGDLYYIGMDRLQLLTEDGQAIDLKEKAEEIMAIPHSVRDLAMSKEDDPLAYDPRIPSALTSNSSTSNGWLAPLACCMSVEEKERAVQRVTDPYLKAYGKDYSFNRRASVLPSENHLTIQFHLPQRLAAIRVWNYSKQSSRGVKEMSLIVDGKVVYMGPLLSANEEKRDDHNSHHHSSHSQSRGQVIFFSSDHNLIARFRDLSPYTSPATTSASAQVLLEKEQDVLCVNERQVMVRSKAMYDQPQAGLAGVAVNLHQRPMTSFVNSR